MHEMVTGVNTKTCRKHQLRKTQVPFIGHLTGDQGMKVDPRSLKPLQKWRDLKTLLPFIGTVDYLAKVLEFIGCGEASEI